MTEVSFPDIINEVIADAFKIHLA